MTVILSYGMGVESTASLARWIFEPANRPCSLADLIVITAQTGGIVDPTSKGTADRAVERLSTFSRRAEAERQLDRVAHERDTEIDHCRGLRYVYMERRGKSYPAREEFYTVAPAHV